MNKKFTVLMTLLFSVVIILYSVLNFYKGQEVTKRDVVISAKLEKNTSGLLEDYEYLLTVKSNKKKDCHVMIYPYLNGIRDFSYLPNEDAAYFVPASVGSDGITEALAYKILVEKTFISDQVDPNLIGFWFPERKGSYQSRLYFEALKASEITEAPVLIAVYYEEKYGNTYSWTQVIEIDYTDI